MPNYVIESGIEIPEAVNGGRNTERLTKAKAMQVGESVLIENKHTAQGFARVLKNVGYSAAVRQVEGGFRVWRVEPAAEVAETQANENLKAASSKAGK